jgi:hypothetical protein
VETSKVTDAMDRCLEDERAKQARLKREAEEKVAIELAEAEARRLLEAELDKERDEVTFVSALLVVQQAGDQSIMVDNESDDEMMTIKDRNAKKKRMALAPAASKNFFGVKGEPSVKADSPRRKLIALNCTSRGTLVRFECHGSFWCHAPPTGRGEGEARMPVLLGHSPPVHPFQHVMVSCVLFNVAVISNNFRGRLRRNDARNAFLLVLCIVSSGWSGAVLVSSGWSGGPGQCLKTAI